LPRPPPSSTLFPYTTLFRSLFFEKVDERKRHLAFEQVNARGLAESVLVGGEVEQVVNELEGDAEVHPVVAQRDALIFVPASEYRSEEHTSELQSLRHLVCRL